MSDPLWLVRAMDAIQRGPVLDFVRLQQTDAASVLRTLVREIVRHPALAKVANRHRGWFDPAGSDKRSAVANFLGVQPTPFQIRTNFFQPVTYVTAICGPSRVRLYVSRILGLRYVSERAHQNCQTGAIYDNGSRTDSGGFGLFSCLRDESQVRILAGALDRAGSIHGPAGA